MKQIEEGEFFELSTDEQYEAARKVIKKLKNTSSWRKGNAVHFLHGDVYKQKKDCKDFIKNMVRSSNFEVQSVSKSEIGLTGKNVVTVE